MPFDGLTGRLAYTAIYGISFWSLTLGCSIRVRGRQHVPMTGPVLFASNHQSYIDPWLVALAVAPRKLTHLARSNIFHRPLAARLIRALGGIPIDRKFGRDGLRLVTNRLSAGEAVVVFPEGSRTPDGTVQPLKPGVALLAPQATVVPVGIAGAFALWPRNRAYPIPAPLGLMDFAGSSLAVSIGQPIPATAWEGVDRHEIAARLGKRIQMEHATADRIRRCAANLVAMSQRKNGEKSG